MCGHACILLENEGFFNMKECTHAAYLVFLLQMNSQVTDGESTTPPSHVVQEATIMGGEVIITSDGNNVEGSAVESGPTGNVEGSAVESGPTGSTKARRTGVISASEYAKVGDNYVLTKTKAVRARLEVCLASPITISSAVTTPYSTPGWDGQTGSHDLREEIFGSSVETTPVAATPNGDPSPGGSGSTTYSEAHRKTGFAGTTPADGGVVMAYLRASQEESLAQQRHRD